MGTDKQTDKQTEMGKTQGSKKMGYYLKTNKYLLIYTPTVIPWGQTNKQTDGHGQMDKYLLNTQG
jgi:hypothetical protein